MKLRLENVQDEVDKGVYPVDDSCISLELDCLIYSSCVESVWEKEEVEKLRNILDRILKLVDKSILTRWHRDYLKVCLKYEMWEACIGILDEVWTKVDAPISVVSEFYFLSGSIWILRRDFFRARWTLYSVLVVPHREAHIPALRKLFLVDLILTGAPCPLPSFIDRRCATLSSIWKSIMTVDKGGDYSPEKNLSKINSVIHPEEYRELAFSTTHLQDLRPRLMAGGDWELALCLEPYAVIRGLTNMRRTMRTVSIEYCMQIFSVSRDQLLSAIDVCGIEVVGNDWIRFVEEPRSKLKSRAAEIGLLINAFTQDN